MDVGHVLLLLQRTVAPAWHLTMPSKGHPPHQFTSSDLRVFARRWNYPDKVCRLLALAMIVDGGSRSDAAKFAGISRHLLQWKALSGVLWVRLVLAPGLLVRCAIPIAEIGKARWDVIISAPPLARWPPIVAGLMADDIKKLSEQHDFFLPCALHDMHRRGTLALLNGAAPVRSSHLVSRASAAKG